MDHTPDTGRARRTISSAEFRDLIRRYVHFDFITADAEGNTLEDLGINLIDQMPEDLTEAHDNLHLKLPGIIAFFDRMLVNVGAKLVEAKDELDKREENKKIQYASIVRDCYQEVVKLKKATDKSVDAYAKSHPDVIRMNGHIETDKKKLRESESDYEMVKAACADLRLYHKSLELEINKRTYGERYAELPNPRPPANLHREAVQQQPPRNSVPTVKEGERDPRDGMKKWK